MQEVALGIDVGTSGVRIAARSAEGELLAMGQAPILAPTSELGRALQDPHSWWQALEQAFATLDLSSLQVLAIAIDGTSGTVLPIVANGNPLAMASMYNDIAEPGDFARVSAVAPPDTAALGSTSPLARAISMATGAHRILHQADWLMGRLCGDFSVSDENNALKTGYDPRARIWPEWIASTGLDPKLLPRVSPAGTRVGTILSDMAKHFKLPADVAIVAGTTDGCAAFLASGAHEAGDGVTSLGTTLTLKLLSSTPVFAPEFGIYSHRIGDDWLAGGASNSGGAAIAQHFDREQIASLTALIDAQIPMGLDYYPLPRTGERFPINDPLFTSRVSPRPTQDHVFLQGLLEGIAAIEVEAYRKLASLGASPLKSMRSVGGGAGNAVWTAIRERMLGVPFHTPHSEHAAMGVARLAWRGIGHKA